MMFANTRSAFARRTVRNGAVTLLSAFSFVGALQLAGCSGKERAPELTVNPNPVVPTSTPLPTCDGLKDGDVCAQAKHCAAGRCVPDTCGDGALGDGEGCDDGNLVGGDGCSPSCNVEFIRCSNGEFVASAASCSEVETPQNPAASPVPTPTNCPDLKSVLVTGYIRWDTPLYTVASAPAGGQVTLRARVAKDDQVLWRITKVADDMVWSTDGLANSSKATNTFTCPAVTSPTAYRGRAFSNVSGCPTMSAEFVISCENVFTPPQADPTEFNPDASTGRVDASARDAGATDAGNGDAGASPAAMRSERVLPADPGRFNNAACRACVESSCRKYGEFSFNFAGPCLEGTGRDPQFAKACSDAYFCSLNAADNCGHTLAAPGPAGCFCGPDIEVQECMTSPKKVHGLCKDEWYAATRCKQGDQKCALLKFTDLERPAFYAYGLLECQNSMCADVCAR